MSKINAQDVVLNGVVINQQKEPVRDVIVYVEGMNKNSITDSLGAFMFTLSAHREYTISVSSIGIHPAQNRIQIISDTTITIQVEVKNLELPEVIVQGDSDVFGIRRLRSMEDGGLYEGKKTEVINIESLIGNKVTNNARQAYSKIPSLNVWESDFVGLQLDIGGRGLSPKRTSNFNTRQNGYDISADALGYPESYYTPPLQAVQQIEVVRGAGALQYGTQFGGLLNFKMKKGNSFKKVNVESHNSYGAFQFLNTFNSVHGQVKKLNYYSYLQYKRGNGWRDNSNIEQKNIYTSFSYEISPKLKADIDLTHMNYLSRQPGGLTDLAFEFDPQSSNRNRNWFRVNWNLASITLNYEISSSAHIISRMFALSARRSSLGTLETPNLEDPLTHRDLIDGTFNNIGNETRLTYSYNSVHKQKNVLLIGTRWYKGNTRFSQSFGSEGNDANFGRVDTAFLDRRKSDFKFPNFNAAVFVEKIIRLNQKLSLIPGIRYEFIDTKSEGTYSVNTRINSFGDFIESYEDEKTEKRRHIFLYGLGLSNTLGDNYELYMNATANYRAINFSDIQIQSNTQLVDSLIKDESGYSFDLGIRKLDFKPFFLEMGLFYVWYDNKIGEIRDDDLRIRTNIGAAQIYGAEFFLEMDVLGILNRLSSRKLSVFINGSINRGIYINVNDRQQAMLRSKNRLEEIPNYNLKMGITYQPNKLALSLQGTFVGEQFSDAANSNQTITGVFGKIPSYQVFDLSSKYTVNKKIELTFDINNFLDHSYFTRRATAYPGPGIIPATGRSWNLTLITKF